MSEGEGHNFLFFLSKAIVRKHYTISALCLFFGACFDVIISLLIKSLRDDFQNPWSPRVRHRTQPSLGLQPGPSLITTHLAGHVFSNGPSDNYKPTQSFCLIICGPAASLNAWVTVTGNWIPELQESMQRVIIHITHLWTVGNVFTPIDKVNPGRRLCCLVNLSQ